MKNVPEILPTDVTALQEMVVALRAQNDDLIAKNQRLSDMFRLAQQKRFGNSSESYPGQGELFNEAEELVEQTVEDDEEEARTSPRKKAKREKISADIPRERVVHDIADEDKFCDCCHHALHQIGEDTNEKLEFIPAQVKVIVNVRPKYACQACEQNGTSNNIKQAPVPASVIPKGYATPSLLSQIVTSKYQFGLPLYRQEVMFKQYGIELSRKTTAQWMMRSADILQSLYDRLRRRLLEQPVIYADETTLKVVGDNKSKSYMWLYACGADSPGGKLTGTDIPNIVLYDYHASRAGQVAVDFLDGYDGYMHVDGYAGYHKTQATLVGCMAHARRKFTDAQKAMGKHKSGKVDWALNHIQKLYRIETQIKDKTIDERYRIRQEESLPLLAQFKTWLIKSEQQVITKNDLSDAIQYCLNQWEKLVRYTLDGRLSIDNNRAERAIKPFVLGRKAWMFSQTAKGAQSSAVLYSIVESAKANGLTPYDYITHLLEQFSQPEPDIEKLLPWNVNLG
ncbi:IS66 family transposase [Paraglaciecola sp. 25GB23A]|uniref:IS66 family transposase n=1 Tax=Paraglaciecola sp. 25GB23A TaxID=3156068 RepID=UPI0032AF6DD4